MAPKLAAGDSFNWPLSGQIIKPFGLAERGVHNDGVDIAASFGSDIQTTAPGTVAYIGTGLKSLVHLFWLSMIAVLFLLMLIYPKCL